MNDPKGTLAWPRTMLEIAPGLFYSVVAYAIWSGLGIVLVTLVGTVLYREIPDLPAILGMALIIAGVVIMNVFSQSVTH